mgnify:CR=1 FL=1
MALSMDEQRILAEIERRLAADDPYLAGNLSAFTRPRLGASIRAAKGRLLATVVAMAAVAVAALMIYSFVPFRVIARQNDQPPDQQTTTDTPGCPSAPRTTDAAVVSESGAVEAT